MYLTPACNRREVSRRRKVISKLPSSRSWGAVFYRAHERTAGDGGNENTIRCKWPSGFSREVSNFRPTVSMSRGESNFSLKSPLLFIDPNTVHLALLSFPREYLAKLKWIRSDFYFSCILCSIIVFFRLSMVDKWIISLFLWKEFVFKYVFSFFYA